MIFKTICIHKINLMGMNKIYMSSSDRKGNQWYTYCPSCLPLTVSALSGSLVLYLSLGGGQLK